MADDKFVLYSRESCTECYKGWKLSALATSTQSIIEKGVDPLLIAFDGEHDWSTAGCDCEGGFRYTEVLLEDALAELGYNPLR